MSAKLKIIIAMVAFGTISIFVKGIPLTSGETAFFRALIGFVAIFTYRTVANGSFKIKIGKKDLIVLILSGAAMAFNWILLFEAYKYTSVSVATLSYYFAPIVVAVVSPLIFKEHTTLKQIVCFVMATAGLVMVTKVGEMSGNNDALGVMFGLGAAMLYASVILLNKFIKSIGGIDRTVIQFGCAIITLFPYIMLTGGFDAHNMDFGGIANMLILGVFHTGICYCLYFSSLKDLKGQQAAILSYIDPMVAIIVSVFVLGESITPVQALGGAIILGFTILNDVDVKRIFLKQKHNVEAESHL